MGAFQRSAYPCKNRSALHHSVQMSKSGIVAAVSVPSGTALAKCSAKGHVHTTAAARHAAATSARQDLPDHATTTGGSLSQNRAALFDDRPSSPRTSEAHERTLVRESLRVAQCAPAGAAFCGLRV